MRKAHRRLRMGVVGKRLPGLSRARGAAKVLLAKALSAKGFSAKALALNQNLEMRWTKPAGRAVMLT